MTSEINKPITSGCYSIEKFYADCLQPNTIQTGGPCDPIVMTSALSIVPVVWTLEEKDEGFFTLMLNKGFASKVGDEKFVFTRPEGSPEIQEWEFRAVLSQGPNVYYIRNRTGYAWTVRGKPDPTGDTQVGLEHLGEVWIPEGPPEEFLFTVCSAERSVL